MLHEPPKRVYGHADIAAILADLQSTVTTHHELRDWAAQTDVPIERVVANPDLTYVRLDARDVDRSPIVLILLEQVWERAI
ncbi:hypothetical protein [Agrococcus carbonis]|uniref:Uncharacterized protein n=1 Tax=Agrococcus carbonis TaxID=684552 RepID=A0A1H1RJR2_9MICO|nr:hypothetical protein [Agrococcus carbonis]SDS35981.1 hypothetical protein SAMN04489719_2140 [Agrococcus carbonis]